MDRKIRIAVVGPGLVGKKHIDLVAHHAGCELAGVVALDDERSGRYCAGIGAMRFDSIADLLAATRVDGMIIASPNVFHAAHAYSCIEAGIPMLIEKPVTATYQEGCRLLEAIERSGARVLVGHHRAHSPIIARARALVAAGALGRLVSVIGSALLIKPDDYFEAGPWRRTAGGGPVLINLVHDIGILRTVCGDIVEVHATGSSAVRGFEVEDTVAMNFRFASGALGSFILSDISASPRSWEQTSGENPDFPLCPDEDCYHFAGTRGSLSIPTMRLRCFPQGADASWLTRVPVAIAAAEHADPLACQLEHFLDVITGAAQPLVSANDGLQNLRICEAVRSSMSTGAAVRTI